MDGLLFLLCHLLVLALLAASLFVSGRMALRRLVFDSLAEEIVTSIGFGYGLVGTWLFLLCALHVLYAGVLWVSFAALHVLGWPVWRDVLERIRRFQKMRGLSANVLLLSFAAIPPLVLGLYPPTGFDETLYHLPYAKAFALDHGLAFLPTLRFPIFPRLAEVLSAALLVVSDDVSTHFSSWIAFVAIALALAGWMRQRGRPQAVGWAAALWLGNPLAVWLAGSSYVDLQTTLFAVLAWIWWDRWRREDRTPRLLLAGAFAGFAAATKYLGLVVVAALVILTIAVAISRRRTRPLLLFAAAAFCALAPWYLRIWLETGNPVFPLFPDLFGANEWMQAADLSTWQGGSRNFPVSVSLYALRRFQETVLAPGELVSLVWRVAFNSAAFGHQPLLSPLFPLIVCAALIAAVWDREFRWTILFCGILFLLSTTHDPRFLLPVAALLSVGAARALERVVTHLREARARTAFALALLFALPGAGYAVYKITQQGALPVNRETRSHYLSWKLPGYSLLEILNVRNRSRYTVYAIYLENLAYFAQGRFLGDWVGPYRFDRVIGALRSGRALREELGSMDAEFLLVYQSRLTAALPQDQFFRRNFRLLAASGTVTLFEVCRQECDEAARDPQDTR